MDLKRKFKDRFVGALAANIKKMTKSGRIKHKYLKNQVGSELQM